MKELYTAPVATVINLAAVEKLAALDGHREGDINTASDIIGGSTVVIPTRPGA